MVFKFVLQMNQLTLDAEGAYIYIYKSQIRKHYIGLSFAKVPLNCLTKPKCNLALWNLQTLRSDTMEPVFPFSVSDPGNGSFSVCSGGSASRKYPIPSHLLFLPKVKQYCIAGNLQGG